jgi:hypothetical protein
MYDFIYQLSYAGRKKVSLYILYIDKPDFKHPYVFPALPTYLSTPLNGYAASFDLSLVE